MNGRPSNPASSPSLGENFVRTHLPLIEDALSAALPAPAGLPDELGRAVRVATGVGERPGSRWRPLLTLASARACGGEAGQALPVAVAVELTHTASLVLDDLPCMDDSPLRRGRDATHRSVGRGGAILLAVSLLARAAELLGSDEMSAGTLVPAWGRAIGLEGMSGGQAVDLGGGFLAGGAQRRLHRRKTTALSAFAVAGGAASVHAPPEVHRALHRFGRDLGWAYQLVDDAADSAEDTRMRAGMGLAPSVDAKASLDRSSRLLRRSLRVLSRAPRLSDEGRELLGFLARRTVPVPIRNQPASESTGFPLESFAPVSSNRSSSWT